MTRLVLPAFAAACSVFVLAVSPVSATTGPMEIIENTTLAADHVGNIVIARDDVTLDCAGHSVVSPAPGEGFGVDLWTRTGVTVKNCVVTRFNHAFNLTSSNGNQFVGNQTANNEVGFAVGHGSSRNTFTGNVTTRDRIHGFWIYTGDDGPVTTGNVLRDNKSTGSEVGVKSDYGAANTTLIGNILDNNRFGGVIVDGGHGNTLTGNNANSNDGPGFNLDGSDGNALEGNVASSNGGGGFYLRRSDTNTLTGNIASDNDGTGFMLEDSDDNTVSGNRATDNGSGLGSGATGKSFVGDTVAGGIGGFDLGVATDNQFTDNGASGNHVGFRLGAGSNDNVLTGNVASHNGSGFSLSDGASGNRLDRNVASDNTHEGFAALGVSGNTWTTNTANSNGEFGFWVGRACSGNTLSENTAQRNGTLNAYDDPANTGNVWTKNTFGTAVFGTAVAAPENPVAGSRFTFTLPVKRSDTGAPLTTGTMACDPSVAGKVLRHAESFANGMARLSFVLPKTAKGKLLKVKVEITTGVTSATKLVAYRVLAASSVSSAAPGAGRPVIGRPVAVPARPLAGQRFMVSFAVTRAGTGTPLLAGRMVCAPSVAGVVLAHAESFKGGKARLALVVPASAAGKLLKVKLTIKAANRLATKVTAFRVQEASVPSVTADTIFFGGTVLTMDPAQPRADAVAVRGERIVAVGPKGTVMRLQGPKTRMIDLAGRTLLPGFNDAHAHWIVSAGGEAGMNAALRGGYTSISELFANHVQFEPLLALSAAGKLRIRVNVYLPVNYDQEQKFGIWFGRHKQGQMIGPHLRMGGAKLFIDPVNPQQMLLSQPHSDQPGYHGTAFWTQQELNAIVKQVTDGGWQIATHTMGDRGLDMILTAYRAALPGPDNGRRFRIEHLGIVRDDQIPVLKRYGILGVIQYPFFSSRDANWVSVRNVGSSRMPWVSRWADLIAAGVPLVGSTDTPATPRPGERRLTTAMQAVSQVVTRVGLGGDRPLAPLPWMLAQRLTVEQALQGLTSAGAYATFEEKTKGTISRQKLADLVILDQNPLAIPTRNLASVKVLATIVGGHSAYCATGARALCP